MASWQFKNMLRVSTFSLNAGTAGERLLGPYNIPPLLTGRGGGYGDFLRNVFPNLLQDMDLQSRLRWRFMHDSAPPHFLLAFRKFFKNACDKVYQHHGQLVHLISVLYIFIFGDICRLSFVLQQSVSARTCTNGHRMDVRWFSCDTWNYPSSQTNALHTSNFRCWNSIWTLRSFLGCRRHVFT